MYVLGLTGSIAMGKSWAAKCFHHFGVPIHDSDACVHRLLVPGGKATAEILSAFPGVEDNRGGVDRLKLSESVFGHDAELALLEHILHPMVFESQYRFLAAQARARKRVVLLDIPLLFETGAQKRVDGVVVASAPVDLQYARALRRPGMSLEKLHAIMDRQVPDALKCMGADFVVKTGATKGSSLQQVKKVIDTVGQKPGKVWGPGWLRTKNFKG